MSSVKASNILAIEKKSVFVICAYDTKKTVALSPPVLFSEEI